ncbi:hydrogenase [Photobacterium aphoticum]|nr:hydrogenase [Photobacterium aphoticum]
MMKIWDLPIRIYHWLQAGLFLALCASGFTGQGPHVQLGLALLALLLWRISWGIIGSDTSRFSQFLHTPMTVIRYLKGQYRSLPGHNPAGGWMVITMITLLVLQCLSGMVLAGLFDKIPLLNTLLTDEIYHTAALAHGGLARGLILTVVVHLLAIAYYKLRKQPLVWAMISGRKAQEAMSDPHTILQFASTRKAIMVFLVSLLVTMAFVV